MRYATGPGLIPRQNEMVDAYRNSPFIIIALFGRVRFHISYLTVVGALDVASTAPEGERRCDLLCTESHAKSRFSTAKPSMISIPTLIWAEKLASNVQV